MLLKCVPRLLGLPVHLCSPCFNVRAVVRVSSTLAPCSGGKDGLPRGFLGASSGRPTSGLSWRHTRAAHAATNPGPQSSMGCPGHCFALAPACASRVPQMSPALWCLRSLVQSVGNNNSNDENYSSSGLLCQLTFLSNQSCEVSSVTVLTESTEVQGGSEP